MPRPRLGIQTINQVHLERIDTRHWRLIVSDGVLFFPVNHVRTYVITDKQLEKLQKQINEELKNGNS